MASIPVVGTRWREIATGEIVEVEHVGRAPLGADWIVSARVIGGSNGHTTVMAKAHWFTTEGFEPVLEDA